MGSTQTKPSSDQDLPPCDYEDKVLTKAQASCNAVTADSDSDEEYYSAEEDCSSCSLTPERTRPESSSAESSSDSSTDDGDSDDNEDYSTEDSGNIESPSTSSSVPEEELLKPADASRNVSVHTDVIQQVSYSEDSKDAFQEHQYIGSKTESIKSFFNGFVSSSMKTVLSLNMGYSNQSIIISQESGKRIVKCEKPSPFTSTQPLQELNMDNTAFKCKEHFTDSNDTACLCSTSQLGESIKGVYTSGGLKQNQNIYSESSESDSDELEKCKERKSRRKRKYKSEIQNRSRRYNSRNRSDSVCDSDERNYGKRKCREKIVVQM